MTSCWLINPHVGYVLLWAYTCGDIHRRHIATVPCHRRWGHKHFIPAHKDVIHLGVFLTSLLGAHNLCVELEVELHL